MLPPDWPGRSRPIDTGPPHIQNLSLPRRLLGALLGRRRRLAGSLLLLILLSLVLLLLLLLGLFLGTMMTDRAAGRGAGYSVTSRHMPGKSPDRGALYAALGGGQL